MASLALLFLTILTLSSSTTLLSSAASHSPRPLLPRPKALVLPIYQDAATDLLVANINGRTPLVSTGFVVDLTARHLWANCETNYKSSTFREPKCGSAQCKRANTSFCHTCPKAARPFCHANTCGLLLENPVTHQSTVGEVAHDVMGFFSTNGNNPGPLVQIPHFLFTCSPSALVEKGLPNRVQGVLGLAQAPIAVQNQLALRLRLQPIFTLCIPSSKTYNGVVFFGSSGPFSVLPNVDILRNLKYTPLSISPFGEYYINVKSIKFNQKLIPIKKSLLSVSKIGTGGTTINTLLPYTVLEGSIFTSIESFISKQMSKIPTVKPISPFGLCYESKHFSSTLLGPGMPSIDLELEGRDAVWSIFGLNSMVEARPGVLCLAFVNGGTNYRAAVNIGTYQMKDVPLQFDLVHSRLGFNGPLSGLRTHCENFNFTSVA